MLFAVLSVGLFCPGCGVSEFDSPGALASYIRTPGNKLTQETVSNGYSIRITYRPTDLLICQEMTGRPFDSSRVSFFRKRYSSYYYFVLSLSRNSGEALDRASMSASHYSDMVQTLSFRMGDYVTLTTSSRDTISVSDFRLNRTFGLSESTDLLFVFNRAKAREKDWVQFNLKEFGLGVGNQHFKFSRSEIDAVPRINFEKFSEKTRRSAATSGNAHIQKD